MNYTGQFSNKSSAPYASKVVIAQALADMGARAVTLTSVARTKPADSRAIYRSVTGTQSQSGQTPTNHQWFLGSRAIRMHAALLLIMYAKYREAHDKSPDAHGVAFALAYSNYLRVAGQQVLVSPERLVLLISHGFGIGWRDILKGGASKFSGDNVKVIKCRKCKMGHLVEAHFLSYTCSTCEA